MHPATETRCRTKWRKAKWNSSRSVLIVSAIQLLRNQWDYLAEMTWEKKKNYLLFQWLSVRLAQQKRRLLKSTAKNTPTFSFCWYSIYIFEIIASFMLYGRKWWFYCGNPALPTVYKRVNLCWCSAKSYTVARGSATLWCERDADRLHKHDLFVVLPLFRLDPFFQSPFYFYQSSPDGGCRAAPLGRINENRTLLISLYIQYCISIAINV